MKKFRLGISIILATSLLTTLVACTPKTNLSTPLINGQNQVSSLSVNNKLTGKWTVGIYMSADNKYFNEAKDNINELEGAFTEEASKYLNIIVLYDGNNGSKMYKITQDKDGYRNNDNVSTVLKDNFAYNKDVDAGNEETFTQFVNFVTKEYPAEHNMIIAHNPSGGITNYNKDLLYSQFSKQGTFGGLGFGTKSFASDDSSRTVSKDFKGTNLALYNLNKPLAVAKQNLGKNLDIFAFDAPSMATIETAYQMYGYVDNMIASEEIEALDGWEYMSFVQTLMKTPDITPKALASSVVDNYVHSYQIGGAQGSFTKATQSAIDVNAVGKNLVPALSSLANDLKVSMKDVMKKQDMESFRGKSQYYYLDEPRDLGHFLSILSTESEDANISTKAKQALAQYNLSIIKSANMGNTVKNSTGLTIYFPIEKYCTRYDSPSDIRFAETKAWGEFLKSFAKSVVKADSMTVFYE